MDDPFRPGGAAPAEEVTDRLLDALAAGDLAAVQRLEAARPDLALGPAAAAAGAARRALAVRSDPAVR
ncbi:MAG TPA: hypothetical protein VKW77_07605, partial [Acidimicrobiales bacterium]|nr:hypothetical protein [Acidimicrobiales bacterium]